MSDQINEQAEKMREMAQTTLDKAKHGVLMVEGVLCFRARLATDIGLVSLYDLASASHRGRGRRHVDRVHSRA